ncbi:MAG TPA: hypothetical protein PLQ15_05190, partial [Syntrophales bacterium]|nr:hypothetical protein [Syntrophales bacterium]
QRAKITLIYAQQSRKTQKIFSLMPHADISGSGLTANGSGLTANGSGLGGKRFYPDSLEPYAFCLTPVFSSFLLFP